MTDQIHPNFKKIAIEASKALNLKLAGVDIITPDITTFNGNYFINEINPNPGLRIHYYPSKGKVRDVAVAIQKYIYENL